MKAQAPYTFDIREYHFSDMGSGETWVQHCPCGDMVIWREGALTAMDWAIVHKCNEE